MGRNRTSKKVRWTKKGEVWAFLFHFFLILLWDSVCSVVCRWLSPWGKRSGSGILASTHLHIITLMVIDKLLRVFKLCCHDTEKIMVSIRCPEVLDESSHSRRVPPQVVWAPASTAGSPFPTILLELGCSVAHLMEIPKNYG